MINFDKFRGGEYPTLDETTPWYEFNSYVECCISLGIRVRLTSYLRYRNYLKSVGIL
jgi:hypothetical protein